MPMKDETTTLALDFPNGLPRMLEFDSGCRRAPDRGYTLNERETVLALKNALCYIPERFHREMAPEFLEELRTRGRIYGYRFRPEGRLWGRPIGEYRGRCTEGHAFQVMIDNNLDFDIALYPYKLVKIGRAHV